MSLERAVSDCGEETGELSCVCVPCQYGGMGVRDMLRLTVRISVTGLLG